MDDRQQFEFLDILAIVAFVMQLQNQSKIFSLHDIQKENAGVVREIHEHLNQQDLKIDKILEALNIEID